MASVDVVRIDVLGHFRVRFDDREVTEPDWPGRRAPELVALLALTERHRLAHEQVIEQVWPHLDPAAGAANLRKAAHHARRALDHPGAVVSRAGQVVLFPDRQVVVDAEAFLHEAERALETQDPVACARAAADYTGELLPANPYEAWTQEPRRLVQARLAELLRVAGDWARLVEFDPADEAACRELMSAALADGQRHVAIRWYERLRVALAREFGVQPSAATRELYDRCTAGVRLGERVFVGREAELAAAAAHLSSAREGGASALLVRGSTGLGKSAFCREVCARASAGGWRVISATAAATGVPYGPIGGIVEQLMVCGHRAVAALPDRTRAILAELTPLAPAAPSLQGPLTRHQVVAALQRALALAGDSVPTVLWAEDAQLLDEASADVLHQLVAGAGPDPLLVLLPYRAEWVRTRLPRGLASAALDERTLALELDPLADGEIAALVGLAASGNLPAASVARIVEAAQGSPFFALELARASAPGTEDPLPPTVRHAIIDRLVGLDPAITDALTALAVAEDELDLASVLALTGFGEQDAFGLLDAALDNGILVVAGARYRFRHTLVRHALTDGLAPHRRLQLHRNAAERLAAAGAPPALIADHCLRGARTAQAVDWLLAAARRAVAVGAFADALTHVERLLVHAPEHHEALCLRAEILDGLGDGRAPEAYATAAVAIGEPEARELRAQQALAQLKASDPDGALRTLESVTPQTTAGRLAEALTLSAAAAIGRYADADTAAAKAQEAHDLATELGDPGAILDAAWAHALAAHAKGELPARLRDYLRSASDLPELAMRLFDGQLCVTERMLHGGLPAEEVVGFADHLAAEAQRIGAARGRAFALTLRGEVGVLAGRLDEADDDFSEGARLHGRIGAAAGEALSLLGRAHVAIHRVQPADADAFLARALLLARESEVGHHTLDRIYGAMVEAAADPSRGVEVVCEAESAVQGPAETCPTCRIAFMVPAAIASARGGDLERTDRYIRDCDRALEMIALPPAWQAAVAEARGWGALAHGLPGDAGEHFTEAAGGFRRWGQPLEAHRCAELAHA